MGTQTDIAKKIIEKKADYILNLKANHPLLHEEVVKFFKNSQDKGYRNEHKIDTCRQADGQRPWPD